MATIKLGEADRIVTFLTRGHGKVRAVAKGIRRPGSRFGARLEPMSNVALQLYRGRELDIVTQVETIDANRSLREHYGCLTHATSMLEAVDQVSQEREPNPALYRMLSNALLTLAATQAMNLAFIVPLKHAGLALAIGLASCLNAGLLYRGLRSRGAYRPQPGWRAFLAKLLAALAVLGLVLWFAMGTEASWLAEHGLARVLRLSAVVAAGIAAYFGSLFALGFRLADFRRRGAMVVATTHHGLLKAYAQSTPDVACASFQYDPATYEPTYRLQLGVPGRSLALEMAERLGLDPAVVADARSRLDDRDAQAEALLKQLESEQALLRREQKHLAAEVSVEPITVSRWERGATTPDLQVLGLVAQATGKPLAFFVGDNGDATASSAQVESAADRIEAAAQRIAEASEQMAIVASELVEELRASRARTSNPS